jgi:hypothetical protein
MKKGYYLLISFSLVACTPHSQTAPNTQPPTEETETIDTSGSTVTLKNLNEIYSSMKKRTGMTGHDYYAQTRTFLERAQGMLSQDGDSEKITPSFLTATVSLAGFFCAEKVKQEYENARDEKNIPYSGDPTLNCQQYFTQYKRALFLKKFVSQIWDREATDEEFKLLEKLTDSAFEVVVNGNNNPQTCFQAILVPACTVILSAPEVFLN